MTLKFWEGAEESDDSSNEQAGNKKEKVPVKANQEDGLRRSNAVSCGEHGAEIRGVHEADDESDNDTNKEGGDEREEADLKKVGSINQADVAGRGAERAIEANSRSLSLEDFEKSEESDDEGDDDNNKFDESEDRKDNFVENVEDGDLIGKKLSEDKGRLRTVLTVNVSNTAASGGAEFITNSAILGGEKVAEAVKRRKLGNGVAVKVGERRTKVGISIEVREVGGWSITTKEIKDELVERIMAGMKLITFEHGEAAGALEVRESIRRDELRASIGKKAIDERVESELGTGVGEADIIVVSLYVDVAESGISRDEKVVIPCCGSIGGMDKRVLDTLEDEVNADKKAEEDADNQSGGKITTLMSDNAAVAETKSLREFHKLGLLARLVLFREDEPEEAKGSNSKEGEH